MFLWISLLPLLVVTSWAEEVEGGLRSLERRSDDPEGWEAVASHLSQQLVQVSAQVTALQNQYTQLQNQFHASQREVYFLATNSADPFNVAARGTLIYNLARYNTGNAYDPRTGVFTAPVPGLYVFHITCMSVYNTHADEDVGVMVDGTPQCSCYSFSNPVAQMGSGLAVVHMKAGQKAWVHLNRDYALNVRGYFYNTFSGFLVRAES